MQFDLLTLRGVAFSGVIREISLATAAGQIAILPSHEALTAIVTSGPVAITEAGRPVRYFAAFGGIVEVTRDGVKLLADEAEPAEEIIELEVEAALARATEERERAVSTHQIRQITETTRRHLVRLEVARLHRRHRDGQR